MLGDSRAREIDRTRFRLYQTETVQNFARVQHQSLMNISVKQEKNRYLIFPQGEKSVRTELFDVCWLETQGLLQWRHKEGRGGVDFFGRDDDEFALRAYRRGGLIANFSSHSYIWSGLKNTRAWRELELLLEMTRRNLPVPRPYAALVQRTGMTYRAYLITYRLTETQTLAERLKQNPLPADLWQGIGGMIRRFHDRHVYHADLNATNILINRDQETFLIDFDKGGIRKNRRGGWKYDNLKRLQRSLKKQKSRNQNFYYSENEWSILSRAYADMPFGARV